MRQLAIIFALVSGPLYAAEIAVPSGHSMTLYDVIMEADTARFRFELPQIASELGFEDVVDDIEYLCSDVAIPALLLAGSTLQSIVISVSSEQVMFGDATDAIQFFQPFAIGDGTCQWDEIYD